MTNTALIPFLTADILYTLEKAGKTIDQLYTFFGNDLVTEKGGNGTIWYDRRQVQTFIEA